MPAIIPPSREKVVQPYFLQISQMRLLVNRSPITAGMPRASAGMIVADWAFPWVRERPVYGMSSSP